MKKQNIFIITLLVAVMLFASAFPIRAEEIERNYEQYYYDTAKLLAFVEQTDDEGVSNLEKIYDFECPPGWYGGPPSYGGNGITPLIEYYWGTDLGFHLESFSEGYEVLISNFDIHNFDPENPPEDPMSIWVGVSPDLWGSLDLSGTSLEKLTLASGAPCHISSINLNDCQYLHSIYNENDDFCSELTALNCPNLGSCILRDYTNLKHLTFQVEHNNDAIINLEVMGDGSIYNVRVGYSSDQFDWWRGEVEANSQKENFIGWFSDGELLSRNYEIYIPQGQSFDAIACYAGDVNGDDYINMADAIMILRTVIGSGEPCDLVMADVNCDGAISVIDALTVLRFSIGV